MGIEKVQVSSKMDEANALFLDWLTRLGKPFPTSRSWWNNECISLVRMLVRSGQIGLPLATLQGIPGIPAGIPGVPLEGGAPHELGLKQQGPLQAQFNFFSHRRRNQTVALVGLEVAYQAPFCDFRRTFAVKTNRVLA
jgi:hypothetical protein